MCVKSAFFSYFGAFWGRSWYDLDWFFIDLYPSDRIWGEMSNYERNIRCGSFRSLIALWIWCQVQEGGIWASYKSKLGWKRYLKSPRKERGINSPWVAVLEIVRGGMPRAYCDSWPSASRGKCRQQFMLCYSRIFYFFIFFLKNINRGCFFLYSDGRYY